MANGARFDGYTSGGTKEIVDGLLSTGDMGYFDDKNRLFVVGREDDMIVSGGENVYPNEIEELLNRDEHIAEAVVVGITSTCHCSGSAGSWTAQQSSDLLSSNPGEVQDDDYRYHTTSFERSWRKGQPSPVGPLRLPPGVTPPIITRGEGVTIWDDKGKSYIDGLSGLFVVQVGHGRKELAEAAAKQAEQLAFFPLWSYATPNAIELAERIAGYAPGDLNRVFFTTGGGEAVESAWKLAKNTSN